MFNFVVLNAKSVVPFNLPIFNFYGELLKSDNLSPILIVVYMKKHMAIVTAKPVVN